MKRRVVAIFVVLLTFVGLVFASGTSVSISVPMPVAEQPAPPPAPQKAARGPLAPNGAQPAKAPQSPRGPLAPKGPQSPRGPLAVNNARTNQAGANKKKDFVYMKSDEGWQMEHNGKKVMIVVGNFAAYHNGTVITADSAVRYSERHVECFGKVLINRGTTYIYGERAEYNGNTNIAKVYDKIIKVVDGDATLYTYNFTFNTKRNVGYYRGGGIFICNENMIESDRGYLYSDKDEVVCVDRVQMRNEDYEMTGDSVVYNIKTDYAQFFSRTNIWNKSKDDGEGDYLYTDRGSYDKAKQLYRLTKSGYILTKEQEMMCDSLDYYRDKEYVLLRNNVQIDDREHKTLLFGDWGEYWKEPGNVFVTKTPSIINYDTSESDSVFMAADSMYLYTRYPIREQMEKAEKARKDSLAKVNAAKAEGATDKEEKEEKATKNNKAKAKAEAAKEELARRKEQREAADAEKAADATPQGDETNAAQQDRGASSVSSVTPQQGVTAVTAVTDTTVVAAEKVKAVRKSKAELRRELIDSLANDTTAQGKALRDKLIKQEAAAASRAARAAVKAKQREKAAARRAELAERKEFFKSLLAPAKVRDAERKRIEKEIAKRVKDSLALEAKRAAEAKKSAAAKADSLKTDTLKTDTLKTDTLKVDTTKVVAVKPDSVKVETPKSEAAAVEAPKVDSVKVDSVKVDTLAKFDTMTVKQLKAYFKEKLDKEKAEEKRIKQDSLNAKLDRIGLARQAKRVEQYRKWEIRDSIYMAKAKLRADAALRRKFARMEKRGKYVQMVGAEEIAKMDSIFNAIYGPLDHETNYILDSILHVLYPETVPEPVRTEYVKAPNIDSLYREVIAIGRVKLFRSDVQAVCDSLATSSVDSIINMYKEPILWNGSNQVTADEMHIHTVNKQVVKSEFKGKPLMAAEIDTAHYNQVTGKEMIALFRDNEIYRNDVNGNVQTIYYMQEEDSPEITLMAYIEAGDMTAYLENKEVVGITYRGNPTYTFYPITKVPETQITKLPDFKWQVDIKPTQVSVFSRTIRPSQRIRKRGLELPTFPIHAIFEQRRKDLLRRREWRDRTDVLSIETKEWIDGLK